MLFVILFALLFGILSLLGLRKLALKIGRGYLIVVGIIFLIGFLVTMFNLLKQGDITAFLIGLIVVDGIIVISLISAKRSDRLEKPIGFCPKCGESVLKSNKFCSRCGTEVKTLDTAADKVTISILKTWGKTWVIGISFLLILVIIVLLMTFVPAGTPFFGASIPTSQVVPPTLIPATKVPIRQIINPEVLVNHYLISSKKVPTERIEGVFYDMHITERPQIYMSIFDDSHYQDKMIYTIRLFIISDIKTESQYNKMLDNAID